MCLAQVHNPVKPVRLEPAATQSRVKHSTTEPLRSPVSSCPDEPRFENSVDPDQMAILILHRDLLERHFY